MIKKIDILGIQLDNYTVRESIMQVETCLEGHVLNAIERVSMQMLLESEQDPVVKDVLTSLDLTIVGEKEILQAAGAQTLQRVKETEEHDFSFEFFKRIERNKKSVFLLGETEENLMLVKEGLFREFPKLLIAGEYATEKCVGALDAIINDMNATTPDVILSVLPTPMQEHFFWEHRDKMNAHIWYGIGASGIGERHRSISGFFRNLIHFGRLKNSISKYRDRETGEEAAEEDETL